jgi:hypothetical protein
MLFINLLYDESFLYTYFFTDKIRFKEDQSV